MTIEWTNNSTDGLNLWNLNDTATWTVTDDGDPDTGVIPDWIRDGDFDSGAEFVFANQTEQIAAGGEFYRGQTGGVSFNTGTLTISEPLSMELNNWTVQVTQSSGDGVFRWPGWGAMTDRWADPGCHAWDVNAGDRTHEIERTFELSGADGFSTVDELNQSVTDTTTYQVTYQLQDVTVTRQARFTVATPDPTGCASIWMNSDLRIMHPDYALSGVQVSTTPTLTIDRGRYDHTKLSGVPDDPGDGNSFLMSNVTSAQTYTFSEPVLNPVLALYSLGRPSLTVTITCSETPRDYTDGAPITGAIQDHDYGLTIDSDARTITGTEGFGLIVFPGEHQTITLTPDTAEHYYNLVWGVRWCEPEIFNTPLDPQLPAPGARAHFSGGLMTSGSIFREDGLSEFVGMGDYPKNREAFPKAVGSTFDGIAIDAGVRCIMYSEENFTGTVILDRTGPFVINNGDCCFNAALYTDNWDGEVEDPQQTGVTMDDLFPVATRQWSTGSMHGWSYGSLKLRQVT